MMAALILVLLVVAVILLDVMALLKAPDSRDDMQSEEWELRRLWRTMR
jgi:hypothetical protein